LASRYAEAHPLTLALDIDVLRGMLGGWLDRPTEAGLRARRMALEIARVQLAAGGDVLVPQFLGRLDFVLQLERLSQKAGAEFVELALLSDPEEASGRFVARARHPESQTHRDATALLERGGGIEALPAMYAQLLDVIARRPHTRTITTFTGQVDRAYLDLLAHLDRP
jgi:hypothetical protein